MVNWQNDRLGVARKYSRPGSWPECVHRYDSIGHGAYWIEVDAGGYTIALPILGLAGDLEGSVDVGEASFTLLGSEMRYPVHHKPWPDRDVVVEAMQEFHEAVREVSHVR